MTPEALAALQARAYEYMAPWVAADFAALLAQDGTRLFSRPNGFVLARFALDEGEILALATDPAHQRQGIASGLLGDLQKAATTEGVRRIMLEVAARNAPAQAFYTRHGYREIGLRRAYYRLPDGRQDDARVMARDL